MQQQNVQIIGVSHLSRRHDPSFRNSCSYCRNSAPEDADDLVADLGCRESGSLYEADDHSLALRYIAMGAPSPRSVASDHRWSWLSLRWRPQQADSHRLGQSFLG